MNYKTATLAIFVALMMLTIYLIFGETKWGLVIIGVVVPVIVVAQVFVVLMAKNREDNGKNNKRYEEN
jgi:uncharacterized membrane protein YbaN (DUF454 family)